MADTVIRNATIIGGTGAQRFTGDVTIEDGHITEVGSASGEATVEVDAAGLVLAPGFVDVHTHDDGALLQHPDMAFKISQVCTSVVVGNCGFAAIPAVLGENTLDLSGVQANWSDLDGYRQNVENSNPAVNAMMLVGHNTIRSLEMGSERRPPNDRELQRMQQHVELAMEQGACGFSTGLIYRPGRWSDTEEVLELTKVVAPFDGIYATHMRNENDYLLEAVDEALEIGSKAGVAVQISHHKAAGKRNWGKVKESLEKVDAAVAEGAKVTLDVYPYTAGSGPMVQYFDIESPNTELAQAIQLASCPAFRHYEGRMIVDIAAELGITASEAVRHILIAPDGKKTSCIQHTKHEGDIVSNLRHDRVMVGSDGIPDLTGRPHPRLFGTFPRVLGRYVREQGVLDLESAVRRMTSLSCDVHGLSGRGRITEGNWADLVLFDPDIVVDVASYEDPTRESPGIRNVWVNGHLAFDNGTHTQVGSGKVLRYREH